MDIGDKKINGKIWPFGYVNLLDCLDWELAHNSHIFGVLMPILMSAHDFDTVIEIGIDRAWVSHVAVESLMAISNGGALYSIDVKEECCEAARKMSNGWPIEHFVLCQDSTTTNWESVCVPGHVAGPILCVVDGYHTCQAALADFRQCDKVAKERSIFLAHDFSGEVKEAADIFIKEADHQWDCVVINDNSKVGIMQKGRRL